MQRDSISFSDCESFQQLVKGRLQDAFSYGNNSIKVDKTGAEIATKLEALCVTLEAKRSAIIVKLASKLKECGAIPTKSCCHGDDPQHIIDLMPMKFDYEFCRDGVTESIEGSYTAVQTTSNTHNSKACSEYNDMTYSLKEVLRDISTANVLKNGINAKDKYSLTVSQLASLGF